MDTTTATPAINEDNRDSSLYEIMQDALTGGIVDDIYAKAKLINGRPTNAMLELLSNAVQDGTCAEACRYILTRDCGPEGLALAEELANRPCP